MDDEVEVTLASSTPAVTSSLWKTMSSSGRPKVALALSTPSPLKRKRDAVTPTSPLTNAIKGRRLMFEQMGTKYETTQVLQSSELQSLESENLCCTPARLLSWNSEVCPSTPQKKIRRRRFTAGGVARRRIDLDAMAGILPKDLLLGRVDLDVENLQPVPEDLNVFSFTLDKVQL